MAAWALAATVSAAPLPTPFNVTGLDGTSGIQVAGAQANDRLGTSASGIGDVNGDGRADFVIGASEDDSFSGAGTAYVLHGPLTHTAGAFDLQTLTAAQGCFIRGDATMGRLGESVSGVGDVDGDGFDDVLLGAPGTSPGECHVLFGGVGGIGTDGSLHLQPGVLDGANGVRIVGTGTDDQLGYAVSGAGDVNGDGHADLLVSDRHADPSGRTDAGEAIVLYGGPSFGAGGLLDLGTLSPSQGSRLRGAASADQAGYAVSGAGDVNGDGFDDVLVGTIAGAASSGLAYLVYGSASGLGAGGVLELGAVDGTNGVRITGPAGESTGLTVSSAGDFNGDGLGDILIGAPGASPGGRTEAGSTYLVFGSPSGIGAGGVLDLATLDGTDGVRLDGSVNGSQSSHRLSSAGDFNGDGLGDVLISAKSFSGLQGFLVYGSALELGASGIFDLGTLDGTSGVRFNGFSSDRNVELFGDSAAGDVNGDGLTDLLLGAPNGVGLGRQQSGKVYVIHGAGNVVPSVHRATARAGDAPRRAVGLPGDGSFNLPASRVWIDFEAGSGPGPAGACLVSVEVTPQPLLSLGGLPLSPEVAWRITTDRTGLGPQGAEVTIADLPREEGEPWRGHALISRDGGATWYLPPDQTSDPVLRRVTLDGQTFPCEYALVQASDLTPPTVEQAIVTDYDNDGQVEAGETLTLVFSRSVVVAPGLAPGDFTLSASGDSLGGAGFAVAGNPFNTRLVDITLGAGVSLTVTGVGPGGASSAIDVAATISPGAIRSRFGVPAEPSAPRDLLFSLLEGSDVVGPGGGQVQVLVSPDAAYTQHRLTVPAGSLAGSQRITLRPTPTVTGFVNAVLITAAPADASGASARRSLAFAAPATLRLEYRPGDVDTELGGLAALMRVHQIVEAGGALIPVPVPGAQTVNRSTRTVEVEIDSLNPAGGDGTPGLFATLPVAPVVERSIFLAAAQGQSRLALAPPALALLPGEGSVYAGHRIEFPGFQATTGSDPGRVQVTIRSPVLFERTSPAGDALFPESSAALFVVETRDAAGQPVAFPGPVDLTVQFFTEEERDLVTPQGVWTPIPYGMRLIRSDIESEPFRRPAGFGPSPASPQLVTVDGETGTVMARGVTSLTGSSGIAAWGALSLVPDVESGVSWH